uniref:Radical SAM protein n=1 Tax=Thermofilum pendens TaxID=2269 RepID=A0A7J3X9H4_THEPE
MTLAVIVDGYTDEPAGLGVPPYVDVYPRYIAGAIWAAEKSASVVYFTIDNVRANPQLFQKTASKADLLVVSGGVVVPGRYIGGTPITPREVTALPRMVEGPKKILTGPLARFGMGVRGGRRAIPRFEFEAYYDLVVPGEGWLAVYEYLKSRSLESVNPYAVSKDYSLVDLFAVRGARIVAQHPNAGYNLTAEIETYRGCPRWVVGGCSFCIEPRLGRVITRDPESIAKEVEQLFAHGVKALRLGRQADFLTYMARGVNEEEFPEPSPENIERLLRSVRFAAPSLEALHIDNVNPMTIALHKEKSLKALKVLLKYHTPGDVAAFGLESADPVVSKVNNLGNTAEDVLEAIRLVNEVGRRRGWNGLPEILPGVNFVLGLPGETRSTFERNKEFLARLLEEGLLVRRVNVREVLPLPGTPMWSTGDEIARKHRRSILGFKKWVREFFDKKMMQKVFPAGTILRRCYVEKIGRRVALARQLGSYPVLNYVYGRSRPGEVVDVVVLSHKARSLVTARYPVEGREVPRKYAGKLAQLRGGLYGNKVL